MSAGVSCWTFFSNRSDAVTGADWLTCDEPQQMLSFLRESGRVSVRKWRLFTVACTRRVWHHLSRLCHRFVEAVERVADGLVGLEELEKAWRAAGSQSTYGLEIIAATRRRLRFTWPALNPSEAASWLVIDAGLMTPSSIQAGSADQILEAADTWLPAVNKAVKRGRRGAERRVQCAIIRDVFFPGVQIEPFWRTEVVAALAKAIYDDRRFEEMPVLADALDDAACSNAELLQHLRGPQVHCRGCWALNAILQKG
jgi:hypothetical protein